MRAGQEEGKSGKSTTKAPVEVLQHVGVNPSGWGPSGRSLGQPRPSGWAVAPTSSGLIAAGQPRPSGWAPSLLLRVNRRTGQASGEPSVLRWSSPSWSGNHKDCPYDFAIHGRCQY